MPLGKTEKILGGYYIFFTRKGPFWAADPRMLLEPAQVLEKLEKNQKLVKNLQTNQR